MDDSIDFKGRNWCGRTHYSATRDPFFPFLLSRRTLWLPSTATLRLSLPSYRKVGVLHGTWGGLFKGSWLIWGRALWTLPSSLLCTAWNLDVMFRAPGVLWGQEVTLKMEAFQESDRAEREKEPSLWVVASHTRPVLDRLRTLGERTASCLGHHPLECSVNKAEPNPNSCLGLKPESPAEENYLNKRYEIYIIKPT